MDKPLAIDLCCGLGGWAEGLLEEGYHVIRFDIERHVYGAHRYPAQLVVQDILTLHGSQFRDAALIVASPPCQKYSYMAMPWKRAKAQADAIRADKTGAKLEELNRLFKACFRIQNEASAAAGRHIPLIVENVKGAQPWVGRARWSYGSFYLWGDVPALMPMTRPRQVMNQGICRRSGATNFHGYKTQGMNWSDQKKRGQDFTRIAGAQAIENRGGVKLPSERGRRTDPGKGARFTSPDCGVEAAEGRKGAGAGAEWFDRNLCSLSSKTSARKMASAMIARIPLPLSRHIGAVFYPTVTAMAAE